ncbi:hypothetical protein [Geminocystis herdmanii]|uniref:hypothetical protein n=1 Tax=Geminocystis herdmanii TaxID=669359 RepID=UPI00035D0745|nr:hypothetical protein [Geminocystis herdmanii]
MSIILLLVGLLAFLMTFSAIIEAWHRFQYLYKYPKRSISQLKKGYLARISGKLKQNNPLISSLITNTQCLLWQVQIYSIHSTSTGTHSTIKKSFQSKDLITIVDRTGKINIEINHSNIELFDHNYFNDHQNLIKSWSDDRTKVFLQQVFGKTTQKNLSVTEKILFPQDKIVIWGKVEIINQQKIFVASKISDSLAYQIYGIILFTFGGLFGIYISMALIWYSIEQLFS